MVMLPFKPPKFKRPADDIHADLDRYEANALAEYEIHVQKYYCPYCARDNRQVTARTCPGCGALTANQGIPAPPPPRFDRRLIGIVRR
jgi:hypothetical protein